MLASWQATAYYVSYVLGAPATLTILLIMIKGRQSLVWQS